MKKNPGSFLPIKVRSFAKKMDDTSRCHVTRHVICFIVRLVWVRHLGSVLYFTVTLRVRFEGYGYTVQKDLVLDLWLGYGLDLWLGYGLELCLGYGLELWFCIVIYLRNCRPSPLQTSDKDLAELGRGWGRLQL